MTNDVCPNDNCNAIMDTEDQVQDFTLTFVFDEADANKEFENVQCYMRSLGPNVIAFRDEADLQTKLEWIMDTSVLIRFPKKIAIDILTKS